MNYQRRYDAFNSMASKIKSRDNRWAVDEIIDSARINADDTIRDEKLLPDEHWDRMFTATLASILSEGRHNHHVVAFFTTRGISF